MTEQEQKPKAYIESLTNDYDKALKNGCSSLEAKFFYAVGLGAFAVDTARVYFNDPTTDRVTPVVGLLHSIL